MTYIADEPRVGHASYEIKYTIGYRNCYACRKETPSPPQSHLDELARRGVPSKTIWPFDGGWNPPGWMDIRELGQICDDCARAVTSLLSARRARKGADAQDASDAEILKKNAGAALELATEGLLTTYPPPPEFLTGAASSYPYKVPGSPHAFRTHDDYRLGMLRGRIRAIRDALLGKPPEAFDDLSE